MTVSKCPHCDEPFRVPEQADFAAGLPRDAYAECPWCNELFMMTAVLGKLPPVLTIKGGDGQPIAFAATGAATRGTSPIELEDDFDPNATITEDEGGRETITDDTWAETGSSDAVLGERLPTAKPIEVEDLEVVEDFQDDTPDDDQWPSGDAEATIADDWGQSQFDVDGDDNDLQLQPTSESFNPAPMKVNPAARPVRKKSSPLKTIIGVAVGGALALPIADGLLTLAGRESILGIWPSKSSSGPIASNVRVNTPGMNEPAVRETVKATGRTLNLPDMQMDPPTESELANEPELAADPESAVDTMLGVDSEPETQTMTAPVPKVAYPAMDETAIEEPIVAAPTMTTPEMSNLPAAKPADSGFAMPESPVVAPETAAEPAPEMEPAPEIESAIEIDAAPEMTTPVESITNGLREVVEATAPASSALTDSIDEANEVLNEIESMDASDPLRRKAMAVAYREIAEVAENASSDAAPARELIQRIKNSPDLVKTYGSAASNWLTYAGRKTPGILIIGKPGVDGLAKSIELESGQPITVSGDADFPDSARVIALGRIVGDGSDAAVEVVVAESL